MAVGRVLVVDDELYPRMSLTDILQLEGYEVDAVPNGTLALQRLEEGNYDVVVLDLIMPGISGLEVLAEIDRTSKDVEIILLTAHSSVESAIAALRHGAVDYLMKPAKPEEIVRAVGKAIQRRRRRLRQRQVLEQLERSVQQLKKEGFADAEEIGNLSEQLLPSDKRMRLPGDVVFDVERRRIYHGDQSIVLSPAEARLLQKLVQHRGEVLSHKDLVRWVQGYEVAEWEAPGMLRPLMSRLRSKLGQLPGGRKWIANVRGVGYVFEDRVDEE